MTFTPKSTGAPVVPASPARATSRCGTRDGHTLSRRIRLDPRLLVVNSRRAAPTMGRPRSGESGAWRDFGREHDGERSR